MNKGKDICLAAMMMELDQPEHDMDCAQIHRFMSFYSFAFLLL